MPALSALKLRFDGADLATYLTASYGDPVESGGVLTVPTDTGFRAAQTPATWGPLDSISAKIIPGSAGTSTEVVCEMLVQSGTGGTDAGFGIDTVAMQVHCMNRVGYGGRESFAYSPATMLYFRMRPAGADLIWETSADGETWSTMRTQVGGTPAWFAGTTLQLTLASRRVDGAGTNSTFDDVNITYRSGAGAWSAELVATAAAELVVDGAAAWTADLVLRGYPELTAVSVFDFPADDPAIVSTNESDGPYTLATLVVSEVDGWVTAGRWRFPATLPSGPVVWALFRRDDEDTGEELARATFVSPVAGEWNVAELADPVPIVAGQDYYAAVWTPNRYVATGEFFDGHSEANWPLTAPASTNVPLRRNGRFTVGGTEPEYPEGAFNAGGYFVDLVFSTVEPTAGPTYVDGEASWSIAFDLQGSGDVLVDGAAAWSADLVATAAGDVLVDGAADWVADLVFAGAGVRVVDGAANWTSTLTLTGAGARVVDGAATWAGDLAATLVVSSGAVGRRTADAVARRSSTAVPRRS